MRDRRLTGSRIDHNCGLLQLRRPGLPYSDPQRYESSMSYVGGLALLALLVSAVWIYNRLVADRALVDGAWSDIDVQLKRRHDLAPQLVNVVRGYADYEKATLVAVTELRNQSERANRLGDKAAAEDALGAALFDLVGIVEAYPALKADERFRQLHESFVDIEDHLQRARRFFNGSVRILNTRVRSFPHLLVAGPMGFRPREFFQAEARERIAPQVKLEERSS